MLLCLLPFPGRSAPPAWHQVEVIIFSHLEPEAEGEVWPVNPGMPQAEFSIELLTAAPQPGSASRLEEAPLRPYLALGQERRRLGGIYRRLRLSAEYRPLLHVAWLQPDLQGRLTRAVRLDSDLFEQTAVARPQLTWAELAGGWRALVSPGLGRSEPPGWRPFYRPPELRYDGFVRLRSARFLHLDIDFAYFLAPAGGGTGAAPGATDAASALAGGDSGAAADATDAASALAGGGSGAPDAASALAGGGPGAVPDAVDAASAPDREAQADYARLTESRRVRLNEIHYFDHPLFGVIVQVSLLKTAPPPEPGG